MFWPFHIGYPSVTDASPNGAPLILVVDDEPLILRVVSRMLADAGYEVSTATSGLQALDVLQAMPVPPSLLLTDIRMTPVDGPRLVQRARELHPGLPVLFMSGYDPSAEGLPGPLLAKPFRQDQLVAALDLVLVSGPIPPSAPSDLKQSA